MLTFMVDATNLVWVVNENYPNLCPKLIIIPMKNLSLVMSSTMMPKLIFKVTWENVLFLV
jgi:hypothetical protein